MKIDPNEHIAGVHILAVRKFLKSLSNESEWGQEYLVRILKITAENADLLLHELETRGFIERSDIFDGTQHWRKTIKGSALGMASAIGKRFDSFTDYVEWPEKEVKLYLKSRSRTISLHATIDEILKIAEHKVVYQENPGEL